MFEEILADAAQAGLISALSLRYFNPIGADPQRRTGQQRTRASHALGKLIEAHVEHGPFTITGVDWPTRDGSAIRDYIHVWDVAVAHVRALEQFDNMVERQHGLVAINLGTGRGTTVANSSVSFCRLRMLPWRSARDLPDQEMWSVPIPA